MDPEADRAPLQPSRDDPSPDVPAPVVVGATGGSGTRALRAVLAAGGLYMGNRINRAGDAMDFEPFLDAVINPVLSVTRATDYALADLPGDVLDAARAARDGAAEAFLADHPGGPWGWKTPRTIFVLPLIFERYPELTFVHLLRDGRDMAFSRNQNQPRKHYAAMFGAPLEDEPPHLASIRLWARVNCGAADWAERTLGPRYLRLRIEDLADAPEPAIDDLFRRLGLPADRVADAVAIVRQPGSFGRWRDAPPDQITALHDAAGEALSRFGYAP